MDPLRGAGKPAAPRPGPPRVARPRREGDERRREGRGRRPRTERGGRQLHMKCPDCGSEESGRYCSACGSRLGGTDDAAGGAAAGEAGSDASIASRLPWILSGLAVLAFAVGAVLLVQERVRPRVEGAPVTGEIPGMQGGGGEAGGAEPGAAGAMPSSEELARMGPREAADRLFDRTMRLEASGSERAEFFADMGLQAYRRVPPAEMDSDARLHVGLLHLLLGRADAAAAQADTILAAEPGNLLGLYLAARATAATGETDRARERLERLREGMAATDLASRPAYEAHRTLLEEAASSGIEGLTP